MTDLNLIERGLAALAPQWGARRLQAKFALEAARGLVRGYDAARTDRRTAGWMATGGSARSEMGAALPLIIRRSRDMCRNNEWAVNARRKLVSHIVGAGIVPRAAEGQTRAVKKRAAALWANFVECSDPEGMTSFYGQQAAAVGEVVEGGACFIRWYVRPPSFGLKVPLQCQVLEHDFLDRSMMGIIDGRPTIHGVAFDAYGRRAGYWLFDEHPGDSPLLSIRAGLQSKFVSVDDVDHVFRLDRSGQVTGVPWLAPLLLRLRDAADYEEAEQWRKKIEACLTVFVRRAGASFPNLAQAGQQSKDEKGRRLEQISPGLIAYLDGGDEISTVAPTPSDSYADHMTRQMLAAAAGIGLTYEQFSGDLSRVNYSSIREGKLDHWAVLDQWQWNMMIPQMVAKAWRRCMNAAAGRGHAIAADIAADYAVPRRPWVDPLKDVKARQIELQMGLTSWSDEVAADGFDPDAQIEKISEERPKLAAAGISFAAQPDTGGNGDAGSAADQKDA